MRSQVVLPAYIVYTTLLKQILRMEVELTNMLNYKATEIVSTEVLDQEHLPIAWPVTPKEIVVTESARACSYYSS